MEKIPEVAFVDHKIKTTPVDVFRAEIERAPIKNLDREFIYDIQDGLRYKELAARYCVSVSRISHWKHDLYVKLHRYYYTQMQS